MKFLKNKNQHPDKHPKCKFCKLVKDKSKIIFENPHIIVVLGRAHHKGHLVVLTKAHEEHLMQLHEKTLDSFFNDTMKICKALNKAIKFDRLNMAYLNNWDPHIHWNIYPRFKKDSDWGQPPKIPKKNAKFKPKTLSEKELKIFKKALSKI